MTDTCNFCGAKLPIQARTCPMCGQDAGFPNVRLAGSDRERAAVTERLARGQVSADTRNSRVQLDAFGQAVLQSRAVMNRSLGALHSWVNGANPLFISFHQQVRSQSRGPQDNEWDRQRISAENTISPLFFDSLNIGALCLGAVGMEYYGPYTIFLKENLIAHRSSAFEENPFFFNQRHAVISGKDPPPGYRAVWLERDRLAMAKLHPKITSETTPADFPSILLESRGGESDCDFIEVHIYGPLHMGAIEHVAGPKPSGDDALLWRNIKRKMASQGTTVEEVQCTC